METGAERLEAEAASADWLRRASSFGAAAAQYAQHRPGYAEAAIRWCLAPVSDAQPVRVADVGAGTGILTGALARLGADVVAVEPDQAMLAELRRQLPGVRAVEGSAEALPLPDQSVDAMQCGQAMHWFDMDRALPEIARVLTPGGVLAGLWNVDDDRVGWVAGLAAISKTETTLGLAHFYRLGEFPLVGGLAELQVEQDQPDLQGAARSAESLVERALYGAGRLAQAEPDREGKRCQHVSQRIIKHRYLIN